MRTQYHILNGDLLKEQLPEDLQGELIVMRECLVVGDTQEGSLNELYTSRAKFLSQSYGGTEQAYYEKVVTELEKINSIKDGSDINLWFEDDLFCQVNFWFVISLLERTSTANAVYLIRPKELTRFGFGGLNHTELNSCYQEREALNKLDKIASLWEAFQKDDRERLLNSAQELESMYPFILPAVKAHLARKPTNEHPGRPTQSLIEIMNDLNTQEFAPVFREFSKRESIYGFGDLQVKTLFDTLNNN